MRCKNNERSRKQLLLLLLLLTVDAVTHGLSARAGAQDHFRPSQCQQSLRYILRCRVDEVGRLRQQPTVKRMFSESQLCVEFSIVVSGIETPAQKPVSERSIQKPIA